MMMMMKLLLLLLLTMMSNKENGERIMYSPCYLTIYLSLLSRSFPFFRKRAAVIPKVAGAMNNYKSMLISIVFVVVVGTMNTLSSSLIVGPREREREGGRELLPPLHALLATTIATAASRSPLPKITKTTTTTNACLFQY